VLDFLCFWQSLLKNKEIITPHILEPSLSKALGNTSFVSIFPHVQTLGKPHVLEFACSRFIDLEAEKRNNCTKYSNRMYAGTTTGYYKYILFYGVRVSSLYGTLCRKRIDGSFVLWGVLQGRSFLVHKYTTWEKLSRETVGLLMGRITKGVLCCPVPSEVAWNLENVK
jgi:hypothetical protein